MIFKQNFVVDIVEAAVRSDLTVNMVSDPKWRGSHGRETQPLWKKVN